MDLSQVLKQCQHLAQPYRIHDGDGFKLEQVDPGDTQDLPADKKAAREALEQGVELLSELQQRLYAENKWAVLLVFQAMDAAGKDGTIKHVMSGVNPQGCQVSSFKAPSALDLDHDYLWRANQCLPERGRYGQNPTGPGRRVRPRHPRRWWRRGSVPSPAPRRGAVSRP